MRPRLSYQRSSKCHRRLQIGNYRPEKRYLRRRSRLTLEQLESRQLLASLTVTTTLDEVDVNPGDGVCQTVSGGCSLRAAIQESNQLGEASGPHQITVPAGVYTLTIPGTDESSSNTGDLNIRASMSILGDGASQTVIDGGGLDRVIDVAVGTVLIQAITIRNGNVAAEEQAFEFIGGGIRSQDDLTLVDSVVSGNIAGGGAGVANYAGRLKIQNSVISGNGDASTTRGGGVFNYSNYDAANLEIINSTISGNQATNGGGLMNYSYDGNANATIRETTISGNTAFQGAGLANRSRLIFETSAIANLSLRNSTVSGNTASDAGGGLHSQSFYDGEVQTDILNSTITGNVASQLDGGGIRSVDSAANQTLIRSTIVAGNSAAGQGDDLFGQSISGNYNLIGNGSGHPLVNGSDQNLVGLDPLLGPLAANGGSTQTHQPQEGSPAIDQGVNSLSLSSDQRGSAFLRTVDFPAIGNASDGTDIGAVEVGQVAAEFDYGDAPDGLSVDNQLRRYPTLSANDGSRHRLISTGPFLGRIRPDGETDGQSSVGASGDDLVNANDEDGFPSGTIRLIPSQPMIGVVITHDGAESGGFLSVWLDVNRDGDWDDPGEQLLVDREIPAGSGVTSLAGITLPSDASIGHSFMRSRISTRPGLTVRGEAPDGEVEDVAVLIGDVPVPTADLSLQQVVDNPNPNLNDTVTFTITITNSGPDQATNVEVTNLLPPEMFFLDATVTQGFYEFEETWFLEVLQPGASAELRIRALMETSDTVQHTAEITYSDQFDPNSTPGNGVSGEDDQATVTLGTCLSSGPLHVGMNRMIFSCASPGAWVGFVHGSQRGTKTIEQYNVTVDIADAEGVAVAVANQQGIASALVYLSESEVNNSVDPDGDPLLIQAFEMLPRRYKSNTVTTQTRVAMLRTHQSGSGGTRLEDSVVEPIAAAAMQHWMQLPLPGALRQRLDHARLVISDLQDNALARVVGSTIIVDADAAGHGWFLDPSPGQHQEYISNQTAGVWTAADANAKGRIDLFTTLLHEYGHLLGLEHVDASNHVMHHYLDPGIRRLPTPGTNLRHAMDVNRDNLVSPADALQIVNWISRRAASSDSLSTFWLGDQAIDSLFLDTNSDYRVSSSDALNVINHLARDRGGEPEGEWGEGKPKLVMRSQLFQPAQSATHSTCVAQDSMFSPSDADLLAIRLQSTAIDTDVVMGPQPAATHPHSHLHSEQTLMRDHLQMIDEAWRQWPLEASLGGSIDD